MKKGTILKLFIAINLYSIFGDMLEISGIIKISPESSFWFAWSIIITVALSLLSTNKYWIGAFTLDGAHRSARYLAARDTDIINSIFYQISTSSIIFLV